MRLVILSLGLYLVSPLVCGQIYTNQTSALGISHTFNGDDYGGGVSFADFDKDGWDDLSFTQSGSAPVFYRNTGGGFQLHSLPVSNSGNMKNLVWVDYDNDNDRDLFIAGLWMPLKLYQNDGSMGFTDVTATSGLPSSNLYMHYSGAWGDYDRDGDLDVYISNYNGPGFANPSLTNILMQNNGDGTFSDVTLQAGVGNGTCYTFQSLWTDYNGDLWPDLMVMNDRTSCDNYLYHNNGDGTFTDISITSGIGNHFIFSMNANGDDYDNDGDLDTYVTNNPFGNIMYQNNGDGTYSEVAEVIGVELNDHSWAGHFLDYDNDSYQDLHVSVSPFWGEPGQNRFFKNEGNGTFIEYQNSIGLLGDVGWHHSSAIGDYNNDGYFDIASVLDNPAPSRIWRGGTNANNWLKVTLQGSIGNKDGIGSWIHCYAGGNHYVRYTYCGEGYLGQNSFSEIFGLGSLNSIDSLIVQWPSGIVDHFTGVNSNQSLVLIEGSTYVFPLSADGNTDICPGGSVSLSAGNFISYLWSNGETTPSIIVNEPGQYSCQVTTEQGFEFTTDTVTISVLPQPEVDAYIQNVSCHGGEDALIILDCETGIDSVSWNDGAFSDAVASNLPIGTYYFELIDLNGCASEGECIVYEPSALSTEVQVTDNLCFNGTGGSAEVTAEGGTPPYQVFWSSGNGSSLPAGNYSYTILDANGCAAGGEFTISEPDQVILNISWEDASFAFGSGSAVAEVSGGVAPYTVLWSSGAEGLLATDLFAGTYTCWVQDANGCETSGEFEVAYNSLEDYSENVDFLVLPVPAIDHVTLRIPLENEYVQSIEIIDLSGRVQRMQNTQAGVNLTIDIRDLEQGTYIIQIRTAENSVLRSKFVKQNN